jgi:hypothetical protein
MLNLSLPWDSFIDQPGNPPHLTSETHPGQSRSTIAVDPDLTGMGLPGGPLTVVPIKWLFPLGRVVPPVMPDLPADLRRASDECQLECVVSALHEFAIAALFRFAGQEKQHDFMDFGSSAE